MRYFHSDDQPPYAPNSYGGPKADPRYADPSWWVEGGDIIRTPYVPHAEDNDFCAAWRAVSQRKVAD
jgi:catalase